MSERFALPPALQTFICITEVERGDFLASSLFGRKFGGHPPPDFGRHIVALYRKDDGSFLTASYLHMWSKGTIGLIGGGCTDGNVIRQMTPDQRATLNEHGGLLFYTLKYCFDRFAPGLEAFFGHCGDARAKAVDLAAGFEETSDRYLLARWIGDVPQLRKSALFTQAIEIGPF